MKYREHETRTPYPPLGEGAERVEVTRYGVSYDQTDLDPAETWETLIARANADLPTKYADDLEHIHIVNAYLGVVCLTNAQQAGEADYVDHAFINFEERTIDFDATHRFSFAAHLPSCKSVSLDLQHE